EKKVVVVVLLFWWCCCCGCVVVVVVVVVVWCWCVAVVVFGSGVVVVNMENYEDEYVTLMCRSKLKLIKLIRTKFRNTRREELFRNKCFGWLLDLDDSQENCVLIHFMTCRQVERSLEDTVAVHLTYHVNGHYIEFRRKEFCLITGLRFGPGFSERYEVGLISFRRLLFDSDTDGGHVTGKMLVDNINGEEFDNLHDEVAVSLCQLAILHFVLLGRQLAHNIPDWWLSYDVPKKIISNFFDGARPNRRLRPDAFEAKAEWWLRSREFFDGRIHEAPPIPTPVKLTSRYDVPKYVDPRYNECINSIKELQKKNDAHEKMLMEVYKFYQGQSKPKLVEVREHYGLSDFDFSVLQNTEGLRHDEPKTFTKQTSSSFFDMAQRTPTYPKTFDEPIPSRHPTSYPGTPHIATPMALQGFAPWSSTNQARPSQNPGTPHIATPMVQQGFSLWSSTNQASPSQNLDVGGVNPDEMNRGKRDFSKQISAEPIHLVSPFNLGKVSIDLNSLVGEVMYMGSCATDDYISLHNVDPNKLIVVKNKYVNCMRFLESPESVFLDCFIDGFVVEVQFWRDLVPYVCKGALYTENNLDRFGWLSGDRPYPSWDDVDIGEGEEDIFSISNNFNLKMSKIADPVGKSSDHIEKIASSNVLRSCSDEIFGGATYGSQHGVINRGGNSFASVLQAKSNKKVVKIQELRNENVVEGAAVAIPFEVVEEVTSRSLIEVSAENELLDSLVIAIPIDKDNGHTLATIDVDQEKKHKNKNKQLKVASLRLPKPQRQLLYRRVERGETSQKVHTDKVPIVTQAPELIVKNSLGPLDENEGDGFHDESLKQDDFLNVSDSEVDEEFQVDHNGNVSSNRTGASTPANEVSAENELLDSSVIAIPIDKDNGHTLATIDVEYEWNPPRCAMCKIFDHHSDKCPKLVKDLLVVNDADEGFVEVKKKKHKNKNKKHKKVYTDKVPIVTQAPELIVKNSFGPLDENEGDGFHDASLKQDDFLNVSDSEDWTSNGAWCNKGTQIVMGWNHNDVDVVVIDQDDQVIHTRIWLKKERKEVFCSFIYAHNRYTHRHSLWRSFRKHNIYIHHKPWSIMGDFNVSLYLEETTACGSNVDVTMRDFRDCVEDIEMLDTEWVHYISGFFMFRVVKKLKNLKKPLRKLLYDKVNVHANVNKLRTDLDAIQTALDADPFNVVLREREATCVIEFNEAVLMEERFLQQKAKIQWLKEGDANLAYFHKVVKSHVSRSRIDTVTNSEGVVFDNNTVHVAFVKHYEMFLGQEGETSNFNYANLFNVRLNDQESQNMVREISNQEVKDAVFSIGDDKSPGPNGFTPAFFKEAWNIIANDVFLVELMHNYHLERGTPRCAFKVDIQKAYDTVNWDFLRIILLGFGFHQKMVSWIMECVTSTSYSICVNGSLHGYFKDVGSASIIKEALDEFKNASSLVPSLLKSKLPVKYLGVPLVSSRLMIRDCNELVDKLMRQFLWSHESSDKGKSKVAWEIVFLPKHEGGLGIRRLECFNSALMASHIWKLLTLKESLWKFIWSKIGNGRNTSLWVDTWADFEPLFAQISPRDIARSGLSLQSKVQDVSHHGLWVCPQELLVKYPFLNNHNTPIREDARDSLVWRNIHGNVKKFSVSQVWNDIRHRDSKVNWYNMVWFPSCIPRHAINLWLIIQRKLKTQDLVPMWDVSDSLGIVCSLCESVPDSQDHLFFECPFGKGIWDRVKVCAGLAHYTPNVYDIIQSLMPIMKRRTTNSMVTKLVVTAATYYVWQERN
nr:putative reverse transcriptase domain, reverse transcriptase zinc-binding domain protein [Tanacetum cinerariifolium]